MRDLVSKEREGLEEYRYEFVEQSWPEKSQFPEWPIFQKERSRHVVLLSLSPKQCGQRPALIGLPEE